MKKTSKTVRKTVVRKNWKLTMGDPINTSIYTDMFVNGLIRKFTNIHKMDI